MSLSFRWRLFLAITLAVLVGTTVEAVMDYLTLREERTEVTQTALDDVQSFAEAAISFEESAPQLLGLTQEPPNGSRFRVRRANEIILEAANLQPEANLAFRRAALPEGYTLELAVDTLPLTEALVRGFRRDLTDDGVQIALSVLIAWALSLLLLRPVVRLNRAINAVSQQDFPDPVSVPPGNDALAQLARSFNRMSANIQAAIERERVFTRYASHELRTPLSAMKLQLESLEMGLSSTETVVPAVQRNLNRMQRVLEALLSLARASEQNHEPVAVNQLVTESISLLPEKRRSRVELVDNGGGHLKIIQPYLMGQCIFNLIDNALKYSSETVEVSLETSQKDVLIRVLDKGEGVPDELLGKLTHTFFRLSDHVEGSGLGLAFVKHIVRTFGGDLKLRNTEAGLEASLLLVTTR